MAKRSAPRRTLLLALLSLFVAATGTGCATAALWSAWNGDLVPGKHEHTEVYQVDDKALLLPVECCEFVHMNMIAPVAATETVRQVWLYVPEDQLQPVSPDLPNLRVNMAAKQFIVTEEEAAELRQDRRTMRIRAKVRQDPWNGFPPREYVAWEKQENLENEQMRDRPPRILVDLAPKAERDAQKLVFLDFGEPIPYYPWWRWPPRILLTPPAVAVDVALLPVYGIVLLVGAVR